MFTNNSEAMLFADIIFAADFQTNLYQFTVFAQGNIMTAAINIIRTKALVATLCGDGRYPYGVEINPCGDRVNPCGDRMNPCGDGINPHGDRMNPCGDGINPCGDGMNPCGDRVNPCGDGINPCGVKTNSYIINN